MNGLFHAAIEVQDILKQHGWSFCFIGGLSLLRWGDVRTTQYVDLSLLTGFGDEEQYIHALLQHFPSRIPDALGFALRNRVLLLSASNGVAVDVSLAGLPFEEQMIRRATDFAYTPEYSLITCSAEDLIVLKAFADRSKDWGDVESIILRQGTRLDHQYILEQLTPLCALKESPDIVEKLQRLFT